MLDISRIKGSMPALITPFKSGRVDEAAYERLIEWQIAQGSHGLVPAGTTGESPTLSMDEHKRVIELCVQVARGRVPVIAGTGSNATAEAIELTAYAKKVGADASLQVLPYYNRPTQEGMYLHIKAVNDAVELPILIYNVPSRTACDMLPATMARCAELKWVVGVKDSTANFARATQQRLLCGDTFVMMTGDDATALGFSAHGGRGAISVTANIAPALCAQFQEACIKGDYAAALLLQDRLMPLHDAMFVETSPGPVKYAAARLGLCASDVRLPLAPVSEATKAVVDAALVSAGLLQSKAAE
jgi:4-hydroxy-tetrahydrodipicolinate synthase